MLWRPNFWFWPIRHRESFITWLKIKLQIIITSILKAFDQRNQFFEGWSLVQIQWLGTGTRYSVEILYQCGKEVETKIQKVSGANSYICKSYWGKSGRVKETTYACLLKISITHNKKQTILSNLLINCMWATIIQKIFGTKSGFHLKWRKVQFLFFSCFWLVLKKCPF